LENKVPDLMNMERGRGDKETYSLFCSRFLPGVIGNAVFKSGCCSLELSRYSSASDETMAFLILANNWAPWMKMAELRKEDPKAKLEDCGVKQKYFKDTKGRGHSWSNAGKHYYNEMYDKVVEDRNNNGKNFDIYFLEYMMKNSEEGKRAEKQKNRKTLHTEEAVKCRRDLPPMMGGSPVITTDECSIPEDEGIMMTDASKKRRFENVEERIAREQARRAGASHYLKL
jgi:hypothetical protein